MPLTDTAIRQAKPTDKSRKLADEKGLYLLIQPTGGKLWRMDYRFNGKRRTLALGAYPDIGLAAARGRREDARKLLANDIDPGEYRRVQKAAKIERAANTFEVVAEITAPEILSCLRRIEACGAVDTAHRALQNCGQVFRYAIATSRAERDPSADLRGALPPAKAGHFAAITKPGEVGALLRAMENVSAGFVVKCALRLAPLLFVRPGELRTT